MFKYRLHWADGSDSGEAEYAVNIKAGEIVWANGKQQLRVLDVVALDESTYTGLLMVEAV